MKRDRVIQRGMCLIMAVGLLLLNACTISDSFTEEKKVPKEKTQRVTIEVSSIEINGESSVVTEETQQVESSASLGASKALTDNFIRTLSPLVTDLGGDYAYKQCDEEQKKLYQAILEILLAAEDSITIPTTDPEMIDYVFNCVMLDHPELFYVDGYTYTRYSVGDVIKSIDFSGSYTMSKAQIKEEVPKIEAAVDICLYDIKDYTTEYDLVKYCYEYIIKNTEYVMDSENNQNIISVFLNGQSVCQGYAKAMQYLLLKSGLECVLVTGVVNDGEGHAWNLVNMDGEYYYVDATWGDASYNAESEQTVDRIPEINYDYLCVTTRELEKSHTINSILNLPECISMDGNYYVKEGVYFTSVEEEKLKQVFDAGFANGQEFLTLKCSDDQVYSEMTTYLLDETHIFDYMQNSPAQIIYSVNATQDSLSFWLY